jgi:hypothetical protein
MLMSLAEYMIGQGSDIVLRDSIFAAITEVFKYVVRSSDQDQN